MAYHPAYPIRHVPDDLVWTNVPEKSKVIVHLGSGKTYEGIWFDDLGGLPVMYVTQALCPNGSVDREYFSICLNSDDIVRVDILAAAAEEIGTAAPFKAMDTDLDETLKRVQKFVLQVAMDRPRSSIVESFASTGSCDAYLELFLRRSEEQVATMEADSEQALAAARMLLEAAGEGMGQPEHHLEDEMSGLVQAQLDELAHTKMTIRQRFSEASEAAKVQGHALVASMVTKLGQLESSLTSELNRMTGKLAVFRREACSFQGSNEEMAGRPRSFSAIPSASISSDEQSESVWEFSNGPGSWRPFDMADSALVDAVWSEWKAAPNPQDGGSILQVSIGSAEHEIDFDTMTQRNIKTGRVRSLRRRPLSTLSEARRPVTSSGRDVTSGPSKRVADDNVTAAQPPHKARRAEDNDELACLMCKVNVLEAKLSEALDEQDRLKQMADDVEEKASLKDAEISGLGKRTESLEIQLSEALYEQARLKQMADEAEETASSKKVEMSSYLAVAEAWKQLDAEVVGSRQPRPDLVTIVQDLLVQRTPAGHGHPCARMKHCVVTHVEEIVNIVKWTQYKLKREQISKALQTRWECPDICQLAPGVKDFSQHIPYVVLQRGANEALLLHGTTSHSINGVAQQGFDDRMSRRGLFGSGLYFTCDACKAAQYCGYGQTGCLILARVILGHPYIATGPMKTHTRPPMVDGLTVPHDSTIARPGIPNGRPHGRQVHYEFVVPREEQTYPEFIIHFRCD